jgi:hypothetical protein
MDLVMPMFVFVMGLVLPFSVLRRKERGESKTRNYLTMARRRALLLVFGFMVENGGLRFQLGESQWAGVLQTIGIGYFVAATLVIQAGWRTQALVMGAILALGWAGLVLVPVPGHGAGMITPEGCLAAYLDQQWLPGRIHPEYYGQTDSNGILPTFMSISTLLLGVLAGHWLHTERSGDAKAAGLAIAVSSCVLAGYVWGLDHPIVRLIWTSYMVLSAPCLDAPCARAPALKMSRSTGLTCHPIASVADSLRETVRRAHPVHRLAESTRRAGLQAVGDRPPARLGVDRAPEVGAIARRRKVGTGALRGDRAPHAVGESPGSPASRSCPVT